MARRRNEHHVRRLVTGRSLVLHTRGLGVNLDKMQRWIERHHRKLTTITTRSTSGSRYNALMGAAAIAAGDYTPDRAYSLTGVAAYDREKKLFMKYMGLARADGLPTQRMADFIRIARNRAARIAMLRDLSLKIKITCPQTKDKAYSAGRALAGYLHYRIRPMVMLLEVIDCGETKGVGINTDDIVLSMLKFYPPAISSIISEDFLTDASRQYFDAKVRGQINYQAEFMNLINDVRQENTHNPEVLHRLTVPVNLMRKWRNSANNALCFLIFARNLGLISTHREVPQHWSCTQQEHKTDGLTWKLEYDTIKLTSIGRDSVMQVRNEKPIWYLDIKAASGSTAEAIQAAERVNRFAQGISIPQAEVDIKLEAILRAAGVDLVLRGGMWTSTKRPVFDLQYDMPSRP